MSESDIQQSRTYRFYAQLVVYSALGGLIGWRVGDPMGVALPGTVFGVLIIAFFVVASEHEARSRAESGQLVMGDAIRTAMWLALSLGLAIGVITVVNHVV